MSEQPVGYLLYVRENGVAFPQKICAEMRYPVQGNDTHGYWKSHNTIIEHYPLNKDEWSLSLEGLMAKYPRKAEV